MTRIFTTPEWDKITKFAYRLMIDKSDFMGIEEEVINDEGRVEKQFISGPTRLLRALIGAEDGLKVISALTKAISVANPTIAKYVDEEKKKALQSTGEKSVTSSQRSTAGRSKKSKA